MGACIRYQPAASVKARLLRDLERLQASGAPYAALVEHLDHIERSADEPVVPTAFRLCPPATASELAHSRAGKC